MGPEAFPADSGLLQPQIARPSRHRERFKEGKVQGEMKVFTRDDGRTLGVIKGFREQLLSAARVSSVRPKPYWSDEDYSAAADRKQRRWQKRFSEFSRWGVALAGAQVLEVGCGDGIDCLLFGLPPVRQVVGIDLQLPLFEVSEKGERTRRLARKVLEKLGVCPSNAPDPVRGGAQIIDSTEIFDPELNARLSFRHHEPQPLTPDGLRALGGNIGEVLDRLPVRFAMMDATLMAFPDDSFDFLWSRVTMEHIIPVDKALTEMARVVRPGGIIYHSIDPYFWLKGCHKTGLVDIPWAHARLTPDEFRRFVAESEGEAKAVKRCQRLKTLNQFTLAQWQEILEAGPFEILEWVEDPSPFTERLLEEHPEVKDSLLEGVEQRDLIHGQIRVWLRNKGRGGREP